MKTSKWIIFYGGGLLLLTLNAFGQFTPAVVTEYNFSLTVNGRATGNDILLKSPDVWEVTVWEDPYYNSPGLGFRAFPFSGGPYLGDISLGNNDAEDPDVALTVDQYGDIHAVVVYYSASQDEYIIEDYIWNSTTFTLNSGPTAFDNQNSFTNTVNIDADDEGYFIVVWDVGTSLNGMTGDVYGGSLNLNSSYSIGSNSGNGTSPDVCISNHTNDRVTYCYLDAGNLYVDEDSYSDLSSGTTNGFTNHLGYPWTDGFYSPRIACPNPNIGGVDDWTVVVLESDNSSVYEIIGFNFTNSAPVNGPIVYNDGGFANPDLSGAMNYGPVVTYDDMSNIFVGWNVDLNGAGATANAIYPLVILCDYSANPVQIPPAPQYEYWEVPDLINDYEIKDYLSLAGKNAHDVVLCSFYDNTGSDVCTKSVNDAPGQSSLKTVNSSFPTSATISQFGIDNQESCIVSIYDLTGRIEYSHVLKVHELQSLLMNHSYFNILPRPGIYFIESHTVT